MTLDTVRSVVPAPMAVKGGTDEEISDRLFISESAIKKTWRSAYERVDGCGLATIPKNYKYHEGRIERGREKKKHLLAYLREHPEELRPFSSRISKKYDSRGVLES
jgi:hypothetical protein